MMYASLEVVMITMYVCWQDPQMLLWRSLITKTAGIPINPGGGGLPLLPPWAKVGQGCEIK